MSFKVEQACDCCGAEMKWTEKYQVGRKLVCSKSCVQIHARHYRKAMREAQDEVVRRFYGL